MVRNIARSVIARAGARSALLAIVVLLVGAGPALAVTGAPTGLTAATPTKAKPALTWVAPASAGAGIAGYNVYRGATKANTTLVTALTFTDSAATANTSSTYTVKAVETGTNLESAASNAQVVVYDTTAPPLPTSVNAAASPSNQKPVLTWSSGGADNLSGFAQYEVWRGTTLVTTTTALTFTDSALMTSGSYTYSIKAVDLAGNASSGATKVVVYDVLPPTTPATFTPAAAQSVRPVLTWAASTDTGGAGLLRYDILRGGVVVGTSTTPNFQDGTVTAEGSYSYTIVAVDKAGNSSNPTPARTVQYDTTAPTVPAGLAASATPTKAKPALGWTAATDTGGSGVVSYKVYRGATLAGPPTARSSRTPPSPPTAPTSTASRPSTPRATSRRSPPPSPSSTTRPHRRRPSTWPGPRRPGTRPCSTGTPAAPTT